MKTLNHVLWPPYRHLGVFWVFIHTSILSLQMGVFLYNQTNIHYHWHKYSTHTSRCWADSSTQHSCTSLQLSKHGQGSGNIMHTAWHVCFVFRHSSLSNTIVLSHDIVHMFALPSIDAHPMIIKIDNDTFLCIRIKTSKNF